MYWITIVGNMKTFFWVLLLISFFFSLLFGICSFLFNTNEISVEDIIDRELKDEEINETKEKINKKLKRINTFFGICFFIGIIGCVFTPSKREMYLIYGVGKTLDYIESNDNVKQLPDKAVEALTRYFDSYKEDNDKSLK